MASLAELITRVRQELGDQGRPFNDAFRGTGNMIQYDLSGTNIQETSLVVKQISGSTVSTFTKPTNYTIDDNQGIIYLAVPLADGDTLTVEGTSGGMFSDAELTVYVQDAIRQHTYGATSVHRYRDINGFIRYDTQPVDITTLPALEEPLVALLATVEALWALSTDASTDIDISTAEGTTVPRSQRYSQIRSQIEVLTDKYRSLAQQLNVGIYRIEMGTLRRVARGTGRLVPVFVEREFDDNSIWPQRELIPVDAHYIDDSGVPTPSFGGWGGP